ncbi:MAG: phage portal protein [Pseudobutyrivibrio sp.]|nr:phage portal protein [Pseudobutyrivibrio sp.]
MENTFGSRIKNAWNAFFNKDPTTQEFVPTMISGGGYSYRPDRYRFSRGGERTIISSIYNRIAVDSASIDIKHVRLDDNDRYLEEIDSDLNNCLTVEANIDQTGRAFLEDAIISMLDEGHVALVPVETTKNPLYTTSYDIQNMRTGKVVQWYPQHVRLNVYNEITGRREDITLPKKMVAIVENPFYSVMNEPNSTLQRLIKKLSLSDYLDEQSGSNKLDLIIQLPYTIKTESRRRQAEHRRNDIEQQLASSEYGIAYTDGTEKITQLNRPIENQLASQIEYLTSMLYSQLGLTTSILDGTADEKTMQNYYSRTIEPILTALTEEMKRKFLSKTARSQNQSIEFFRDPFKLVPTSAVAEMADKFTRNEIMTSNEIRQVIGMKPSDDPNADELRNKNLSAAAGDPRMHTGDEEEMPEDEGSYEDYEEEGPPDDSSGFQNIGQEILE